MPTGTPPPSSSTPPPQPLISTVLKIAAPPWTAVGEDIIQKNQTPPGK